MKLKNIINIALVVTCFSSFTIAHAKLEKVESTKEKKESMARDAMELVVCATLASWLYSFATSGEEPIKACLPDPESANNDLLKAFYKALWIPAKTFNTKVIFAFVSYLMTEGYDKTFNNTTVSCDEANAITYVATNRRKGKKKEVAESAIESALEGAPEGGCGCC